MIVAPYDSHAFYTITPVSLYYTPRFRFVRNIAANHILFLFFPVFFFSKINTTFTNDVFHIAQRLASQENRHDAFIFSQKRYN